MKTLHTLVSEHLFRKSISGGWLLFAGTLGLANADDATTISDRQGRSLTVTGAEVVGANLMFFRSDDGKQFSVPLATLAEESVSRLTGQTSNGVNFHRDIRPILEANCVGCHGTERQKGGLRLDTREAALEGGDDGPSFVEGDASQSHLYQLVTLHADDSDRMPADGDPLTAEQQQLLKRWIEGGAPWAAGIVQERKAGAAALAHAVPGIAKRAALRQDARLQQQQSAQIDAYLDSYLAKQGTAPGKPVSDEVFVRRAYLDIAGRIPTLDEYEAFMADRGANKRDDLVGRLLDSPAFVSHTLNQWFDALRVKYSYRKIDMTSYRLWLRKAIQENMPYDRFAREQLVASGHIENPEAAAVGYLMRDRGMPEDRIATTMQLFLGTSMVCAQCHDHPTDKWTQMDYYKLLAFFEGTMTANGGALGMMEALQENGAKYSEAAVITADGSKLNRIRTEAHYKVLGDVVMVGGAGKVRLPETYAYDNAKPNQLIDAGTPFGTPVKVDYSKVVETEDFAHSNKTGKFLAKQELPDVNSRTDFADWATSPDNPMFTKTIVNRLWSRVFGVPLVGDLINLSESDMGPIPGLTAHLIALMKSVEYDQKLFLKILYQTNAYQRTALAAPAFGEMPVGAPVVKRLSTEQIWDSLVAIRSPEPDAGVTEGTLTERNVLYLEMNKRQGQAQWAFVSDDRPVSEKVDPKLAAELVTGDKFDLNKRASLLPSPGSAAGFLGVFGQADREIIDDSVREATITQALYLMNGEEVINLAAPKAKRGSKSSELVERLRSSGELTQQTITWAYNAILSRSPTARETSLIKSHLENRGQTVLQDLCWSLTNTNEFKLKQ